MFKKQPERLCDFYAEVHSGEIFLDSNDIFRELRKAQRACDMVNNRPKGGRRPITEADLRLLQKHLNRQKKKISHLNKLIRDFQNNNPGTLFYITPLP